MHGNRKAGRKSYKEPMSLNIVNKYYHLGQRNRGKCLIFNHTEFDIKGHCLATRPGSDADVKALDTCFTKLGYSVQQRKDRKKSEITNELEQVAQQRELSSVVVIVLTHQYNKKLAAKDCLYCMEDLFEPFRGDRCKALVGRPKIFLIQVSDLDETTLISIWADFMVFHSTVPGYLKWNDTREVASFVIQRLVYNIEMYHKSDNLENILIVVSREAFCFIQKTKSKLGVEKDKAIKTIVRSTLTHGIHFNPSSTSSKLQPKLIESGRCLIINNEIFPPENLPNSEPDGIRKGSNKDVNDLMSCFQNLNFEVTACNNGAKSEILAEIEREANASVANDCFVCIISTHGGTPTQLYGVQKIGDSPIEKDPYDIQDVFLRLDGLKALKNKPVIIFIHSCQGKLKDHGTGKRDSSENECQTNEDIELNVPWPNFFVARSSYPGYLCYRGDVKGSWFLQSVVEAIETFGSLPFDIHTMSHLTNRLVSTRVRKIKNTNGFVVEKAKQTCCFWSTLNENVAFHVRTD